MPRRLRPTAPIAASALIVGDPGRALLLAQELLEEPKMSNHARGLWGYGGVTAGGTALTIQSTGMGGPSAAVVLADLAKLGVRRAVRIGTCVATGEAIGLGDLLVVDSAKAEGTGEVSRPDPDLNDRLRAELGRSARAANVASFDTIVEAAHPSPGILAADMQTATVLACGPTLGMAVAAVLIVETDAAGERISDEMMAERATLAGRGALAAL